ncbi:MAG: tetratricopeptide repeat protein [Gemmatimonadota bacterium]|nr:MAG: tetratricopeptide repeat protein [Gemmatimonadota bacterium]
MRASSKPVIAILALLPLAGCQQEQAGRMEMATADVVMTMPVTTSSEEAMQDFMRGQHAMDMGRRTEEANAHFRQAVEKDPQFCMAYLRIANTAQSPEEFRTNLETAAGLAEGASEAERLLVDIAQKGLENNVQGQLQSAERLVEIESASPRAWLALAGVQATLGQNVESRAAMTRATELAPELVPAYVQLANSYLFLDPKDFTRAEEYAQRAVELAPGEPMPHDMLGDVYRAQNELEQARDAYTRAAELDPTNGSPLQQRGHVNSFLGNYDEARADYDAAIALGTPNEQASYAVYRAHVSVYAGDPQAAIDELNEHLQAIDGMNVPNARGAKIFALSTAAFIALHHRMFEVTEHALQQEAALRMELADEFGTDRVRRFQLGVMALNEGWLAAFRGDYATASAKAQEYMELVEPDQNPRKHEPAHDLLGQIELLQGNHEAALAHFEQGVPTDIYMTYMKAVAHEGAGNAEQARELYETVARYNFNNVGYALVRADAIAKISG